jgi:GH25 family lysozyme M1 (1,4-beta-N-acetylmuramidase)
VLVGTFPTLRAITRLLLARTAAHAAGLLRRGHGLPAVALVVAAVVASVLGGADAGRPAPVRHTAGAAGADTPAGYPTNGIDVSHWEGTIDWSRVTGRARFAYVKATEGVGYVSATFEQQYSGARSAGLYTGAYAFGRPDDPAGARAEADFLLDHAQWQRDGRTLPPMLDMEWPYKRHGGYVAKYPCYGLSPQAMVAWIGAFVDEVHRRTAGPTVIYTARDWWDRCTAGSSAFSAQPLFVASYNRTGPKMPEGWSHWTIWQYSDRGRLPGDQNVVNGGEAALSTLAHEPFI